MSAEYGFITIDGHKFKDPLNKQERAHLSKDATVALGLLEKEMERHRAQRVAQGLPANPPHDPIAPSGKLWRCGACGKTTKNQYGDERGWDESCMLNSYLVDDPKGSHE